MTIDKDVNQSKGNSENDIATRTNNNLDDSTTVETFYSGSPSPYGRQSIVPIPISDYKRGFICSYKE